MKPLMFYITLLLTTFPHALHADDDPWAKLEDSPSMTCIDNEAELNRMWVQDGDLFWSDYGNVSAICRKIGPASPESGDECVVKKRDGSNEWFFKLAATDTDSSILVENFFNFDIGEWDAILEINGFSERSKFPCW